MGTLVLTRPQRVDFPAPPDEEPIQLPQPPPPTATRTAGMLACLFPLLGGIGMLAFSLANPRPRYILVSVVFMFASVGMGVGMYFQQRSAGRNTFGEQRRHYLAALAVARERLSIAAAWRRDAEQWAHPDPLALWSAAGNPARCWERRSDSPDFLQARVGVGARPFDCLPASASAGHSMDRRDPVCEAALAGLTSAFAVLPALPLTVRLDEIATLAVVGPAQRCRGVVRALLAQLVTFHAPDDLRLAVCRTPESAKWWEWVKWLPHIEHPEALAADGPVRLVCSDLPGLAALVGSELTVRRTAARAPATPHASGGGARRHPDGGGPHLVMVVDLGRTPAPEAMGDLLALPPGCGVTVVVCVPESAAEPTRVDCRLRLADDGLRIETGGGELLDEGVADLVTVTDAEALARTLAPYRLSAQPSGRTLAGRFTLTELLDVPDPAQLDVRQGWRPRPEADRLRAPIGLAAGGETVSLDLKDWSVGGMGSHGLLVGATGSGKSELLRTLVVGLAARHAPDELAFVLVDFKGGATFSRLGRLPHVAGAITNLEQDPTLADRMLTALDGELDRRQRVLKAAGELDSADEYRRLRATRNDGEPLPSLFVVVDEFGELLVAKPEFVDLFGRIGRLGRSLGVHLLLASQRLEEGRLRGLENHLNYRIALRTFSEQDSRSAIGVPDAYRLPGTLPGSAYLKVGPVLSEPFRTARVSSTYRGPEPVAATPHPVVTRFVAIAAGPATDPGAAATSGDADRAHPSGQDGQLGREAVTVMGSFGFDDDPSRQSVADVVVDRLRAAAPPVRQVWLPPLGTAVPLSTVVPPSTIVPPSTVVPLDAAGRQPVGLATAIGLVDRPAEQHQEPLVVDLAGGAGNVAVVGGPQSGKSTLLRTLVCALARAYGPRDVQFYCVDSGGGLLAPLAGLPQVGTVAGRGDPERVRRVVAEMHALMAFRQESFPATGVDSIAVFRARRRAKAPAEHPDDEFGDAFLVIDNWAAFALDHEDLVPSVQRIATGGLNVGVHLVISANRWLDMRPSLRDAMGTRFELRLGTPSDSEIDRRQAARIPTDVPGRGLTTDKYHFQVALPRVDGRPTTDGLAEALDALVKAERVRWPVGGARPVRVLPTSLRRSDLPVPRTPEGADATSGAGGVPIAVAETDLGTVRLDLTGRDPHFLILGDGGSGKTTFLRSWLTGFQQTCPATSAKILVVDYRRSLLGAVHGEHLLEYAGSAPATVEYVGQVAAVLESRIPGPDVTPEQMADRSWWTGSDVYVVVDDYDVVASSAGSPLAPLLPYLPLASDVGLHMVLSRRVGGMARTGFEPVIAMLRDLATPGLILSGDPGEGPVLGPVRATHQPPGRGLMVRRGTRPVLVQTAWDPPDTGR
ncbi:type VII secretion protein EccCb [Frankia sp. R82]|uniref:type VII secretion protein EccCb n=1 Tax=Frankia sp. R82 TaxID=2950553 RepID=UPI002042C8D7|nr:type VII secretion protein EccCb [Frankia sp. R82]MCM3883413.1 type VII secretion protein EccCb [Frankia sp. R82]